MNYGLSEEDIKKIQNVFRVFPQAKQVILYGSRAKGNYKPGSDIDLTIKGDSIELQTLNQMNAALESLHTPYTFDLSIFAHIKTPELIEHIERVGKVFYSQSENAK